MPSNYDDLIAHENEHSGLDFKAAQYTRDRHEAFLTDVMAMANAAVTGERLIIIGVKHRPDGSREHRPIPQDEFVDGATYQQLVRENIEPNLEIEYVPYRLDQALFCCAFVLTCVGATPRTRKATQQHKKVLTLCSRSFCGAAQACLYE